ncbi:hypothetical protein Pan216_41910 [Planctomycetes bacterium Pan216]|uniref:DUF1559 domain-containing protein n=1 Tax=Kolteria novifilia TaxID=2527975 RepID=A0A518B8M8_9BACT|nr:hypothetical protein Pan216_41910 [Planctomycetes bacterium Pan216]
MNRAAIIARRDRRRPRLPVRRAMTLVELLVVIAIVGVLVSMTLPAVQQARESARAAQCANNLKQIAHATASFCDMHGAFPPARIVNLPTGVDPPELDCGGEHPSWIAQLLPFLDQQAAADQWDLTARYEDNSAAAREHIVASFVCPTRRAASQAKVPGGTTPPLMLPCGCSFPGETIVGGAVSDYAGNHGDLSPGSTGGPEDFYFGGRGTGVIISSRGICDGSTPRSWYDRVAYRDIDDGTSNTFLVGEMHVPRGKLATTPENGPMYDGSRFYNSSRAGGPGLPLAQGPDDDVLGLGLFAFGSWHPGVCHFAFADGHVESVGNLVNTELLGRYTNRADGEITE